MHNCLFLLIVAVATAPAVFAASDADGIWSSQKNDDGGYIEITIADCKSDTSHTCGVITKAFSKSGEDPDYPNLGKNIIENMKNHGDGALAGGIHQ